MDKEYDDDITWDEMLETLSSPEVKEALGKQLLGDVIEAMSLYFPAERVYDVEGATYRCATCGRDDYVTNENGKLNNCCGYCGQRIDWGDGENGRWT